MELSEIFRFVNLAVGAITVLGGVVQIFGFSLQNIIIGGYMAVFGLSIALLEFQIPPQIARYAAFLFSLIGRGIFYIFIGSMLINQSTLSYISGGSVVLVGIAYVALEFIPSIEPPANMREAEAGSWGAETV